MVIIFVLSVLFYFLVLLQTTLLVYFPFWGILPNFAFIFVLLVSIFEKKKSSLGLFLAIITGFFLDIFSDSYFIGFYVILLAAMVIFVELILKKYTRVAFFK